MKHDSSVTEGRKATKKQISARHLEILVYWYNILNKGHSDQEWSCKQSSVKSLYTMLHNHINWLIYNIYKKNKINNKKSAAAQNSPGFV